MILYFIVSFFVRGIKRGIVEAAMDRLLSWGDG